ncbi:MAG TPA: hypothetical protein VK174_02185, partial [Chitinophagales bacterium]|nr:hypothetical protein [Chitinophagales bacterium]
MRKNLLQSVALVLLLAISVAGYGQNLVLNPSFEITNNNACPAGISEFGLATDWGEGNSGQTNCTTSDLYAGCASQIGGANSPNALLGFQASRTGTHHAGIILAEGALGCALMGSNYREYIEGKLSQPLTAGQKYVVRFYMSMPDEVMGATDDFGVYFSNTYYSHDACVTQLMPVTPQLNYCGPPIVDTLGWTEVKWIYTAVGGETFFTIGNFKNDANTTLTPVNCGGFVQNPYLYYFIDDVEISALLPNSNECAFTVVTSSTPKGCTANDGTATVIAAGCSSPFQYAWAGGGSNATLNNLAAGTYTVTVSDANCSATSTVSVAASTAPAVQITSINANCGASNGTAIANPTGTGPFTYAWSGGGNAQVKNNLGAGTYTVTVTGAGNCTATASASITA